jgi:5-methylcytosine-specific restriction endonuclease McrA
MPIMSITNSKRRKVYKRDGNKCCKCGTTKNLTVDHIVPLCRGGHNGMTNMQTLCEKCNLQKGDRIKLYNNRRRSKAYVKRFYEWLNASPPYGFDLYWQKAKENEWIPES